MDITVWYHGWLIAGYQTEEIIFAKNIDTIKAKKDKRDMKQIIHYSQLEELTQEVVNVFTKKMGDWVEFFEVKVDLKDVP